MRHDLVELIPEGNALTWKRRSQRSPAAAGSVFLAAFDEPLLRDLTAALAEAGISCTASSAASAGCAVLCIGPGVSGAAALDLIEDAPDRDGERLNIVLAAGDDTAIFQDLLDDGRLFYLSHRVPLTAEIVQLLGSAVEYARRTAASRDVDAKIREICELARYLGGESDPRRLGLAAAQVVEETVRADRARCLFHDIQGEELEEWTLGQQAPAKESAAAGIVGYVVRTGCAVRVERVGEDPRYDAEADNGRGDPAERMLAVPVILPRLTDAEATPRVLAVMVALRNAEAEPFAEYDVALLRLLADRLAPSLDRVAVAPSDSVRDEESGTNIFRLEALQNLQRGQEGLGRPMAVSPRWARWAFPLLILAAVCAAAYSVVGKINEYARGLAFVRLSGGTPAVIALFPGRFRPQLAPGMPLHFKISGYAGSDEKLVIDSVSEIVGPSEARRFLGPTMSDLVPLGGPLVIVQCRLSSERFRSGDERYRYYQGLLGSAEVTLRSSRILFSLLPSLKVVSRSNRGE
jgi:hypothetical protein